MLYSAAGGSVQPWAVKQAIIFIVFLGVAVAMSWMSEATIKSIAFPLYGVTLIMLIGVEALGFVSKGAQRWLDLGPIRLQPSEFMKPAIVLTLARFYELVPAGEIRKWRAIWPAFVLLGVPAFLILVQPDLGTCIMVVLCGVTVMFLAGLPWWLFAGPAAAIAVAAPIVYGMMHGYQRKRIDVFLDPESDPLGAGYHIAQSKIAIGSGGIWGKGFLHGSQSHLDYLPEGHTDFVFATMAEEWGLVGGVLLIFAFGAVIRWGMRVSDNARTRFAQLAAAGLSATIFFYVVDQPDDGDGPGAGRRRALAAGQLRRVGGDDGDAVPRAADGARAPAAHWIVRPRLITASGDPRPREQSRISSSAVRSCVKRRADDRKAVHIVGGRRAVGSVDGLGEIVEPFRNAGQRCRRGRAANRRRVADQLRRAGGRRTGSEPLALAEPGLQLRRLLEHSPNPHPRLLDLSGETEFRLEVGLADLHARIGDDDQRLAQGAGRRRRARPCSGPAGPTLRLALARP